MKVKLKHNKNTMEGCWDKENMGWLMDRRTQEKDKKNMGLLSLPGKNGWELPAKHGEAHLSSTRTTWIFRLISKSEQVEGGTKE